MKRLSVLIILCQTSLLIFSQQNSQTKADTLRKDAINVYMNASSYIKKEVPFINYVRDKNVADLIVIDTYQQTGSGGGEYTFYVEGKNQFQGVLDTVSFNIYPDETEEMVRSKGVRILKMGLMKYIIQTPLADYIDIRFTEEISDEVSTDKWNSWVFRAEIEGGILSNETTDGNEIGLEFNVSRVTEDWKINFNAEYEASHAEINTGQSIAENIGKNNRASVDIVRSITDHWSLGLSADMFSSIYRNYELGLSIDPVIEYNFFPYSESTRRQFTLFYSVGARHNNYIDSTQFFKVEESLYQQKVQASYRLIQQWGTIGFSARWSNYLHDLSLNNLSFHGGVDLKVAKGLKVGFSTSYSFIHDQISLRKGSASVEDILLNRKEVSTSFLFTSGIRISYTFGSIYNNVVNPRLDVLF